MDKLQLSVWIEDAAAGPDSFGSYCLKLQADDMEVPEAVLLLQMQKSLTVMKQAIDYGLTGGSFHRRPIRRRRASPETLA